MGFLQEDAMMNRKIALICALPLALGLSTAWAQDDEEEEVRYGLPGPAAHEARDASGVMENDNAQAGLATANEATMRVMDDAEAGRPDAVTATIPLPPGEEEDTQAVENAQESFETAGDGGVAAIEDAKSVAADQAQDALTAAQEAIEQRGRGNPPEDPPTPPDVPEPPSP
jgi:hypothetical protein